MENLLPRLLEFAADYGIRVVGAVFVLIAGRAVAGITRSGVRRALQKRQADAGLTGFLGSLAYALVIVFTIIAALANFGVEVASFVAVLGAASFAVGFALQGSLSNFAAGVMILLFRPFKVGDFINAAGVAGTVKDLGIFTTTVATGDNVQILIPNGKLFGDVIHNFSAYDTRRVDLIIGIGYGSSIDKAFEVIQSLIRADSRILPDPAPFMAVSELADSSVNLVVRVWVNRVDYLGVKLDLHKSIKESFDAHGIEIPFPQRVVHTRTVSP